MVAESPTLLFWHSYCFVQTKLVCCWIIMSQYCKKPNYCGVNMLSLKGEYFWLEKNILLLQYCFSFLILFNYLILVFVLLSKYCICICIFVFVFVFLPNSILYVFKRVRGSVPVSSHVMFVQSSLFLLLATKTKLVADLDGQLPLASLRAGDSWAIHRAIEGNFVFRYFVFYNL